MILSRTRAEKADAEQRLSEKEDEVENLKVQMRKKELDLQDKDSELQRKDEVISDKDNAIAGMGEEARRLNRRMKGARFWDLVARLSPKKAREEMRRFAGTVLLERM